MQLCAILKDDDLRSIVDAITPLRLEVRPRRVITLGRPAHVALVAGAGLRIRGDARFIWDVGGLTFPVTLRSWQVLLVPSFVERNGRHVLAFDACLEELDFKSVPMFLDERIAAALKDGLAVQKQKFVWDFAKHLSLARPMPAMVTPRGEVTLAPVHGNVAVTATEIRLTLTFAFHIEREELPASRRPAELPSRRSATAR